MADPNPPSQSATEDQQKKEALAAFTATLHSVGTNLDAPLRDRATTIAENEVALQRQEAELAENTARLAKQNAQWAGFADETREGLKEIGDVQNWAEMIERDLLALEDMMDGVEKEYAAREAGQGHSNYGGDSDSESSEDRSAEGNGEMQNGNPRVNGANGKSAKPDAKPSVNGRQSGGWLRWW
ncbi:GCN5-like 1 [Penicillium macrosclerotiorum]|uniref:GCN5-like 1 n=1 Tax=Penicillium macrosclerotiorum TaxID=303699 RepID=UPI0025475CC9|nr:GCN5-like 1 [Penicillium macrosclerotiorum]KAJ5679198.1 GCN5-like 1 [Penicillium macrosclerotiorum]